MTHALEKYNLYGLTGSRAVTEISDTIVAAADQKKFAETVVFDMTGEHYEAPTVVHARMMAKYVVRAVVNHTPIDFDEFNEKIADFIKKNTYVLTEPKSTYIPVAVQVATGRTSAVTANGRERGKKGEKQTKAIELFKANPTMSGADLTKLFVKELGMTTTGARTYAYNVRKVWV